MTTPKDIIIEGITWFAEVISNLPIEEDVKEELESELSIINSKPTMKKLKDFEIILFRVVRTIDDKNVVKLWNDSLDRMNDLVIEYRKQEYIYKCNCVYRPRHLLFDKLLKEMLLLPISDDSINKKIERVLYNFEFTAPEFDERMCEHFSTIDDIVRINSSNRDSMEEWQVQINNLWIEFNDNVREINTIYTSGI
jgi:hypothetical protein